MKKSYTKSKGVLKQSIFDELQMIDLCIACGKEYEECPYTYKGEAPPGVECPYVKISPLKKKAK